MRKAFREGRIDYVRYDASYPYAMNEESASSLILIALNRLRWPAGLSDQAKGLYRKTVRDHLDRAFVMGVEDRDIQMIEYLTKEYDPEASLLDSIRDLAIDRNWGEGAARIIQARAAIHDDRSFELDW